MTNSQNSKTWNNVKLEIFNILRNQGASFLVLGIATYLLWVELQEVKTENRACNQQVIETLTELVIENQRIIERNTTLYMTGRLNQNLDEEEN